MHDIEAALNEVMAAYKFIATDKILDKINQMHEIHCNHRSLILLGTAGIGKSSILRMYRDVLGHGSNQTPLNVDVN